MSRFDTDSYMRQEFDRIIKNYGHNIYLQRRLSDGSYKDSLEIHTVRFSLGTSRGLPDIRQEATEGILNSSKRIYHFRYDAEPFENDRIYEVEPTRTKAENSLASGRLIFIVDTVAPMYGIGGNLVYWQVGATRIFPS